MSDALDNFLKGINEGIYRIARGRRASDFFRCNPKSTSEWLEAMTKGLLFTSYGFVAFCLSHIVKSKSAGNAVAYLLMPTKQSLPQGVDVARIMWPCYPYDEENICYLIKGSGDWFGILGDRYFKGKIDEVPAFLFVTKGIEAACCTINTISGFKKISVLGEKADISDAVLQCKNLRSQQVAIITNAIVTQEKESKKRPREENEDEGQSNKRRREENKEKEKEPEPNKEGEEQK